MEFDIQNHQQSFPHVAVVKKEGRVYLWWMIGNQYARLNGFYGEYPPSLLERIKSLFPGASPILHLFSGTVQGGLNEWTVDLNQSLCPDVCCRAEEIADHFEKDFFSMAICDPPYSKEHAKHYNCKMPNTAKVMRELYKIVQPEGMVAWVSTLPPLYRKEEWRLAGMAALHSGTNRTIRGIFFMEKI